MQYKYVTEQSDYSDLASGRVFHSLPGHPAFPVRLASEIFQRCIAHRQALYQVSDPCTLYDPCCGAAYHLSVLAYLHREHIREVIGSDIDEKAVALVKRNLELVSVTGLEQRIAEIAEMSHRYGKASHQEALKSAQRLRDNAIQGSQNYPVQTLCFRANATSRKEISDQVGARSVDIIFTDIPYGQHSNWQGSDLPNPISGMLDALKPSLSPTSVVAIAADKQQKVTHENYQRIEHFQIGKRRVVMLKPI